MSNLTLVTDNMLPVANETFIDNLSAGISAGAAIVPINSLAEYADGDSVVLTVDPGTASQATFIGEKQGNTVIDCKWTEGNVGASHAAGATVIDYDSSTHYNVVTKLLRMTHTEVGDLKTAAVQKALNISSAVPTDYTPLAVLGAYSTHLVPTTFYRRYNMVFPGVDYTDRLQARSKLRIPRTVAVPTTSMNFSGAAGAYASKAAPAGYANFNSGNVFGFETLIKIPKSTQNSGVNMGIVGRYEGSAANAQFYIQILSSGVLEIAYFNGGNSTIFQSTNRVIPTDRTVHVAGFITSISGQTCVIYIDGKAVSTTKISGNASAMNTTSTSQLSVGYTGPLAASNLFTGKMYYLRIWSALRTQQQLLDSMFMNLPGATAGLVDQFNGNGSWNTSTTSGNNLTANNAGATNNDPGHAFNAIEYGEVIAVSYAGGDTTVTLQMNENSGLPNEPFTASSYSNLGNPRGYTPVYPFNSIDQNGYFLTDPGFGGKKIWKKWSYFDPPAVGASGYVGVGAVNLPDAAGMSANGDANIFNIQRSITIRGSAPYNKVNFENNTIYVWNVSAGGSDIPGIDVFMRVEEV